MRFLVCILITVVLLPVVVIAQNTGTVSQATIALGPVLRTTYTWTAGTNNNSVTYNDGKYVRGELLRVELNPTTGSTAPTGAYTIVLSDAAGVDILAGLGAAATSNAVVSIAPGIVRAVGVSTSIYPFAINDPLTLSVTNCGNSRSGYVHLYTR
jgi:hypothetical protein